MALVKTIENNTMTIRLNDGLTPQGGIKIINLNVSGIKKTALTDADKEKMLNIADYFRPVSSYAVYQVATTTKEALTWSD